MMTGRQIAELIGARPSSSGWVARCPAHQDKNPSLSLRDDNGRVLLHCFAGCTPEAVCSALGIRLSDLFSRGGAPNAKPRIVREAERAIADLRSRLTPRERVLPVTVVYCGPENFDAALARALALAVEGEIVQVVFEGRA
jgi:hypothetical protein